MSLSLAESNTHKKKHYCGSKLYTREAVPKKSASLSEVPSPISLTKRLRVFHKTQYDTPHLSTGKLLSNIHLDGPNVSMQNLRYGATSGSRSRELTDPWVARLTAPIENPFCSQSSELSMRIITFGTSTHHGPLSAATWLMSLRPT